ncbi:hypothetical protein EDB85DRAFT_1346228 [Lactarius pseudohatsudake]|nr:hypothetical protein EDB85DRAFT_1346228 [Lactarius pseudohatsudake]
MSDEQYLAVLKASYDYVPQSGDEIEIKEDQLLLLVEKTDDDWWRVKIKGDDQSGLVPSAYVESAEHSSIVEAQYDYVAVAEGELSVKEDQLLLVFGPEEDGWLLVQDKDDGKVGYVPGNYIEAVDDAGSTTAVPATPHIVVSDSPYRRAHPVGTYVDPAELVRSTASKVKSASARRRRGTSVRDVSASVKNTQSERRNAKMKRLRRKRGALRTTKERRSLPQELSVRLSPRDANPSRNALLLIQARRESGAIVLDSSASRPHSLGTRTGCSACTR